jgi:hypothetical protein
MKRIRKLLLTAAIAGVMAIPGTASAATEKDPDCTWTNDNIAVCEFKAGGKVCYDHYGKKIDCPATRQILGVASIQG